MGKKKYIIGFLTAAAAAAVCLVPQGGDAPDALEIPSGGSAIIAHDAYSVAYNTRTMIPDWVAYELTSEEADGRLSREGAEFRMDPELGRGRCAMREDYSNSGWTKGHMMPAADAAFDSDALDQTFYLSNICPQSEALNAGDWEYLERKVRKLAHDYGRVWVVTGPIVGTGRYGTIGDRKVVVPDAFFKSLLVEKGGSYSAIAFVMGNDDGRYYLRDCAISVDELEARTGFDFYPALPDDIEAKAESTFRLSDWGIQ